MNNLKNRPVWALPKILLLLALALIFFTGCAKERILKKYYVLESSMSPVLSDSIQYHTLPYSVLISPFTARPAFQTKRIVMRSASNEIQYYVYHLWGDSPDIGMRFFIWRRLQTLHLFRNSTLELTNFVPDYIITGAIDLIEREAAGLYSKKPVAHVKMSIEFKEFKTGKIIVEHSFDRTAPLPRKSSMNDFVAAVNRILNHETDVFIAKIVSALK